MEELLARVLEAFGSDGSYYTAEVFTTDGESVEGILNGDLQDLLREIEEEII